MAKNNDINSEIEQLKRELDNYKRMFDFSNISKSNPEKDITFISLDTGMVNLSTEKNGEGQVYPFTYFGEEQSVSYSDAKLIVKNNKSFIKDGIVYIDDEDFIKSEKLTSDYKDILNVEQMMSLFKETKTKFATRYSKMKKRQRESFSYLVREKIAKGEEVDMNIVQIINEDLHCDIINENKSYKDLIKEIK